MNRLGFNAMSGAFSAALAAVVITLLFACYLPYGAIVCGIANPAMPEVRAGDAFWESPETLALSVQRNGDIFLESSIIPTRTLSDTLRKARTSHPDRPLELRVDRRVKLGQLEPVLSAAREAGYSAFYVIGRERSILELAPTDRARG